jgi:hypothetical protein
MHPLLAILLTPFHFGIGLLTIIGIFLFAIRGIARSKQNKNTKHKQIKKPCVCGGWLVERTAHRGLHYGERFLGCTNYPKCQRTERI